MDPTLGEFVMAGDVIEMRVAGHRHQRLLGDQGNVAAQADHAPAGIDQQIALPATQVPDVAAVEFLDVGLVDPGHAIRQGADAKPVRGVDVLQG